MRHDRLHVNLQNMSQNLKSIYEKKIFKNLFLQLRRIKSLKKFQRFIQKNEYTLLFPHF